MLLGLAVTLVSECEDVMLEIALISLMMLLTRGESLVAKRVLVAVPPVVRGDSVMVTVVVYELIDVAVSVAVLGFQDASCG